MNKVQWGKKGIFFTFIAITIMGVFLLMFTPQTEIALDKEGNSVETRINTINNYAEDVQSNYYNDVLKSSTYKAMISLTYYMNQTGTYLPNLNGAFSEVMISGTLNGNPIDSQTGKKIMENNTLLNWSRRIEQLGAEIYNVNATINLSTVSISQTTPWQVEVTLYMNYTIRSEVATWSRKNFSVISGLSIEGWIDPAYLVENNGLYVNRIVREPTDFNDWNLTYIRDHITNGTYVYWPYSSDPNFLTRFEGKWNVTSACCGIHSLARPTNLTIPDKRGSYVDFMLWNNSLSLSTDCSRVYNITHPASPVHIGVWDKFRHFKLDLGHLEKYNITSEYYTLGGC
jgi:hypothetical protein